MTEAETAKLQAQAQALVSALRAGESDEVARILAETDKEEMIGALAALVSVVVNVFARSRNEEPDDLWQTFCRLGLTEST